MRRFRHSKKHNNETAKLLAFTGPIVCKVNRFLFAKFPDWGTAGPDGRTTFKERRLEIGELVIVFRGPRPSGDHALPGGTAWLIYTNSGPMYFETAGSFSSFFDRI